MIQKERTNLYTNESYLIPTDGVVWEFDDGIWIFEHGKWRKPNG
jgi:hypothetical protein